MVYKHVKQYWCETIENFGENDQRPEFWLIWGPKYWAFDDHIVHISESSSNEHIKLDVNAEEFFFNKIVKNLNFDWFESPKWSKNLDLWGLYFTHQQK